MIFFLSHTHTHTHTHTQRTKGHSVPMSNTITSMPHFNFCGFFKFNFYWTIFALHCSVSFYYTAKWISYQFSSVQSFNRVWLFATPWIAAHQASLSITNSRSSLKLMSIESVMPSSHLILCCPLLLLPPIPPSIRVFFQWVNSSYEVAQVLEFQL